VSVLVDNKGIKQLYLKSYRCQ